MKKVRRMLYILLAVAVCVAAAVMLFQLGLIGGLSAQLPPVEYAQGRAVGEEIPCGKKGTEEFTLLAENGDLALYLRTSDANFYVRTAAGECWYAFPPEGADTWARGVYKTEMVSSLIINYIDLTQSESVKKNSRAASVQKNTFTLWQVENGFRADYTFKDGSMTIPVEVTLEADHLNVRIVTGEIEEEEPEKYILSNVRLLPNFGGGAATDEGYVFVPDGQGALMHINNGKGNAESYKAAVYGDNASTTQMFATTQRYRVTMPVFGVKRNDGAFLAVITGGENAAYINAMPGYQNTSYTNAWAEYKLRFTDSYILDATSNRGQTITLYQDDAIEVAQCEQRYYFLDGEQADYSGMAACYRAYLLEEGGLKEQDTDDTVLFMDLYAAVVREENVLGIPVERQRQLSGLTDVLQLYERLRTQISGGIRLRVNSWSKERLKGKLDTELTWAAGNSWEDWQRLASAMAENGDTATLAVGLIDYEKGGNGIVPIRDSAMALSGSPAFQYAFKLSTRMRDEDDRGYLLHPALLPHTAQQVRDALEKRQVSSVSPDLAAQTRYGSYGKNSAYPEQTQQTISDVLADFSKDGEVVLDTPNAFALKYAAYAVNTPSGASQWDVMDESVPFLQMVYGGLLGYAGESVNLSADPAGAALYAIATGEALHYELITGDAERLIDTDLNRLVSARLVLWEPKVQEAVSQVEAARAITGGSRLVHFTWLSDKASVSVFENGAELCVNAGKSAIMWDGLEVPGMTWRSRGEVSQ